MSIDSILLIVHIASGMIALGSGLLAAFFRKRKGAHSKAGNSYFYSMLACAVSAIFLSSLRFNPFLMGIGWFTLYMVIGGKWVLRGSAAELKAFWKYYALAGAIISTGMIVTAGYFMITYSWNRGFILLVFGFLQSVFTFADIYKSPAHNPKRRVPKHINKMSGAFIATISAFLVTNITFLPTLVIWLGPTIAGSILIYLAHRNWAKRMAGAGAVLFFCLGISYSSPAQVYIEKQSSQRFAQLTLGLEAHYIPQGGAAGLDQTTLPSQFIPKFHIGGTHFWGHAEFYVTFPLSHFGQKKLTEDEKFFYSPGIETGAKIYPWRIEKNKVRPYFGISMAFNDFSYTGPSGDGSLKSQMTSPLELGLTYQKGPHLLNLGLSYRTNRNVGYHYSRNEESDFSIHPWTMSLGWKYQLETTISAEKWEEQGIDQYVKKKYKEARSLSGFSLAIGPSASFVLGNSAWNSEIPFLGQHSGMGVFFDFGLGYYYEPWDAHINLAFRQNKTRQTAYDFSQKISRRSSTLEVYKFLFDYHGFVPFIGINWSFEELGLQEADLSNNFSYQTEGSLWTPGITFGWDIRPNEVQTWILRTNLRYIPLRWDLNDGRKLTLDQLEFNFIQLVWYPSRWFTLRKL